MVLFSTSADTCRRDIVPGSTGVLAFNITSQGKLSLKPCYHYLFVENQAIWIHSVKFIYIRKILIPIYKLKAVETKIR